MKKILFIVGTHGNEQPPLHLFYNYPYGRNTYCEWEVIVSNPSAVSLNQRYIDEDMNRLVKNKASHEMARKKAVLTRIQQGKYDVVYDMHTSTAIKPVTWPDCAFINHLDKANKNAVAFANCTHVIWDWNPTYNSNYMASEHPAGVTLEYQKTGDYRYDVERILSDFLQIVEGRIAKNKKIFYKADIPVTQKQRREYAFTFEDFKPLTKPEKNVLGLNGNYVPVFINPSEVDPEYYCFLNREIK